MKTTNEADLYRESTALLFGDPMTNTTTKGAVAHAALLTIGTLLVVGGAMSATELSAGMGLGLAMGAGAIGATVALARSRLSAAL
ncbi:MAG: hypothetical protein ACI9EZ_000371 [Halobacteriales archaeon]|jgi:hypothetical protein